MIRRLGEKSPKIHPTAFVSEAAYVIGDVEIGEGASIWPGTVIRGDTHKINIGKFTNIQDNSVLHGDSEVFIGDYVTIGHRVMCHGKNIGDRCLIGNGAIVNDGVVLGSDSVIGSGSMVLERMEFPDKSIVMGMPARIKGSVKDKHLEMILSISKSYAKKAETFKAQGDLE
ncbi:MAG: gamma carbonic anhydrase family protein [Dehalococcoidia bacterium]